MPTSVLVGVLLDTPYVPATIAAAGDLDHGLGTREILALVAVIAALCAYLAAVRLWLLREARDPTLAQENRGKFKTRAKVLILPDILLVTSGVMLLVILALRIYGHGEPENLLPAALIVFGLAIAFLVILHMIQWFSVACRLGN